MAIVSEPEPAHESRTRRWILIAFLVCYVTCAPLWYITSRVHRESLPSIEELQLAPPSPPHILPLQLHIVPVSGRASGGAFDIQEATNHLYGTLNELRDASPAVAQQFRWDFVGADMTSEQVMRTFDPTTMRDQPRGKADVD